MKLVHFLIILSVLLSTSYGAGKVTEKELIVYAQKLASISKLQTKNIVRDFKKLNSDELSIKIYIYLRTPLSHNGHAMDSLETLEYTKQMSSRMDAEVYLKKHQGAFQYYFPETYANLPLHKNSEYQDALEWSQKVAKREDGLDYIERFKKAFSYFDGRRDKSNNIPDGGVGEFTSVAFEKADIVANRADGLEYIDKHKKAFNYFYKWKNDNAFEPNGGLSFDLEEAIKKADIIAERADGLEYVEKHKVAFNYFKKKDLPQTFPRPELAGLFLPDKEALKKANNIAERTNALELIKLHKEAYYFYVNIPNEEQGLFERYYAIKRVDELVNKVDAIGHFEAQKKLWQYYIGTDDNSLNLGYYEAKKRWLNTYDLPNNINRIEESCSHYF